MRPAQARLIADLLPQIAAPTQSFDPRDLAPDAAEVWLEIGFGGGEHLAAQAFKHPEVLLLGAEPFVNGIARALRHVCALGLTNVRLHAGDARELMAALPPASVDRVFLLFPDPWPKARHHKRRLVQASFIEEAARVMKVGAVLRFATDWSDYADHVLERFAAAPDFRWTARGAGDWRQAPADHVTTRYEAKRLGDCDPLWLEFERAAGHKTGP